MSSDKSAFDKWEVYTFPPELNDPYVNPCDIMEPLFHKFLEECIAAIEESEEEALLFKFAYIPPKSRDNYKGPFRYNVYRNNYVDNITQFLEFVVISKFSGENKKYKPMFLRSCEIDTYLINLILMKPSK